jgi:hypothetical protein
MLIIQTLLLSTPGFAAGFHPAFSSGLLPYKTILQHQIDVELLILYILKTVV